MGAKTITSYVWLVHLAPPLLPPVVRAPHGSHALVPHSPPSLIADTTCAHGYAMAALLVGMGVMAVMPSVALPVWNTAIRREREAELKRLSIGPFGVLN